MAPNIEAEAPHDNFDVRTISSTLAEGRTPRLVIHHSRWAAQAQSTHLNPRRMDWLILDSLDHTRSRLWRM